MKARRKGSLSYIILDILEKAVDGYSAFEDFAYNPMLVGRDLKKSGFSQAIKRLKEAGLVEQIKVKSGIILKLTSGGKELMDNGNDKDWDGKWRIAIFDIPEEKRVIRNLFRRNLKKWGFKQLQKSVWISKRDVFSKLRDYVEDLGIERWVSIIESNKFSHYHNM